MSTADDRTGTSLAQTGELLKQLRQANRMSLASLAVKVGVHRTLLNHVERGTRRLQLDLAKRCDTELGSAPALEMLAEAQQHNGGSLSMRRRAVIWMITSAIAVSKGLGAGLHRTVADELLRRGLQDAIDIPDDWEPALADFQRRLVLNPSASLGRQLAGQLLIVRQALEDEDNLDNVRAAATLSLFYGLWKGNAGEFPAALDWYRTAAALAHESKDPSTETYVLGRSASRGIYEGMSRQQVEDNAKQALAVTDSPTLGALEAHSAMVHLAALSGDITSGRRSVNAMRELAEVLPDDGPTGAYARTVSFHNFLEARAGDVESAEEAHYEAETALAKAPLWLAEADVYHALSLARAGNVRGGAAVALEAIQTVPWSVHTLAIAASDVLTAVPRDDRTDEVMELRKHASPVPGPWETL